MLSVEGVPELRAAAAFYGRLDGPTRAAIRRESASWAPSLVRRAVAGARSKPQGAVAASGRTSVTGKGLTAVFGSAGSLHGEPLRAIAGAYEFGTGDRDAATAYVSRHRVTKERMTVTRRARRQLPRFLRTGHFIYPAVADTTPELVGRWLRAIVEAAEARR